MAERDDGDGRAPTSARLRWWPVRLPARTGLRWKLSAAIALVGVLVAVALSLVVHNAARASMLDNSRDLQAERLSFTQRIYESTGRLQFGARIDDPALPKALRAAAVAGHRATFVVDDGPSSPAVWAAEPLTDGRVLSVQGGLANGLRLLDDLDRALLLGSGAVVLGGCALGVAIGGRLSRRLRKAAVAAGELAEGETSVRVRDAVGGRVGDETDDLARAVDAMADALQDRIEAERRVTADIAHELRTPVTGLLTAAELLPPGRPSELVRDRAQALRTLVEDVLEVARLDGSAERAEAQEVLLGEFVTRRVRALDAGVEVEVVREARVSTDPRRLERILGNLVANALHHGAAPVRVTVDGPVVRVRDHGRGFPEDLLRDGPSRFRTGSRDRSGRGHGLGLTIATGQARVLGARLTFRNTGGPEESGHGAVCTLRLPPPADGGLPAPAEPPGAGPV